MIDYVETSAKTGEGVLEAFQHLSKCVAFRIYRINVCIICIFLFLTTFRLILKQGDDDNRLGESSSDGL